MFRTILIASLLSFSASCSAAPKKYDIVFPGLPPVRASVDDNARDVDVEAPDLSHGKVTLWRENGVIFAYSKQFIGFETVSAADGTRLQLPVTLPVRKFVLEDSILQLEFSDPVTTEPRTMVTVKPVAGTPQ
jgi:hypothetical protein